MRVRLIGLGMTVALTSAVFANTLPDWDWLFPIVGSPPAGNPADQTAYHVPGSARSFSDVQIHDLKRAVDWFPAEHPQLPAIVASGHGGANACGYCHLATGNGRPENSSLAGLPADYIKRQVQAFANGSRRSVVATAVPIKMMVATAKNLSPSEIDEAAGYFASLPYKSRIRVVETAAAAFHPARFIYVMAPGPTQAIGNRIIEVPVDPEGFERRDPHMDYTALVPLGSIAAGGAIVASGGPAGQPCAGCHGENLRGGLAPALAGRSPTGIVRQLAAFQSGARSEPEAEPMRVISHPLDARMMVAIAAYAATLKP